MSPPQASGPGKTSRSKVVDPETGSPQRVGYEGLLLGWYVTDDVAKVVEEGFIFLTGRLSRSSKIAGEMVPHGGVEEAIEACVDEGAKVCVIANPDEDRGEKLIALYEGYALDPAELAQTLAACDLLKLWLPKRDALPPVEALPVLGTGQLDPPQPKNWPNKEPNRSWYKSNALR